MAEEISWDTEAVRNQAHPAVLEAASQAYAGSRADTDVLDYIYYGLGKIARPLYQKAQNFYSDRQEWGDHAHARYLHIANGLLPATDTINDQDESSAAGLRRAAEQI